MSCAQEVENLGILYKVDLLDLHGICNQHFEDWRSVKYFRSCHNFLIVCRDGQMYTSKEALYFCSPFFREFFNGAGREADKIELMDTAIDAAKTVSSSVWQTQW